MGGRRRSFPSSAGGRTGLSSFASLAWGAETRHPRPMIDLRLRWWALWFLPSLLCLGVLLDTVFAWGLYRKIALDFYDMVLGVLAYEVTVAAAHP